MGDWDAWTGIEQDKPEEEDIFMDSNFNTKWSSKDKVLNIKDKKGCRST